MSVSIDNFIKAIYKNGVDEKNDTKPGSIAKKLNISNAAATDMAKKLATRDVLHYEKYQPLQLTEKGTKLALNIIRKHRLWETLLYKLFDMSLFEIHQEAEVLEHQTSDDLAKRINAYLGNPKFDPHGDPIPDEKGEIHTSNHALTLSDSIEGKTYTIARLMSDDKEFFDFCALYGLKLGSKIMVTNQFQFNKMTQVSINNNTLLLNESFTNIIYVNEINQKQEDISNSNYKLF
ncbi:iron dependent repressor, metal binding and dimerization domain protein [Lacinutrix iliipiscaria]|uniref:Transcriptional regulator MntR n=1 Tax=Lacinutrix iliipiscaria TaxID=1230532 RepID=A0ABW5WMQ3_9FLAO